MENVLELQEVTKRFPNHLAVDNVSLTVERGSLFALLGPSGCGKTTILRMVAGFETPTAGRVLLNGADIGHLPPHRRDVNTVFQSYALFPHLTARANIEFGLRRKATPAPEIDRLLREVLELVQLAGKQDRLPNALSGGERQRVALARALVMHPQMLLLDEPLSALDPLLRKQVRFELKSLQRRTGITFLIVTHDQEEALSLSDRIAVMNRGRIEQIGSPREIYLQPASRFVASFLGAVNWINGTCVRPEATRISTRPPEGRPSVPATVDHSLFLGNCVQVTARLDDGAAAVAEISRLEPAFQTGQPVHLWWDPADELRFPQ